MSDASSDSDPAGSPAGEAPTRIVGIGASAGGLEALEGLFGQLPANTGMAFVVVQHLSPDFRSLMDELIARHSTMPVIMATDGMAVVADHIYLMPPKKEMIIRERRLVLTDKDAHTFSLPIDRFFRSLAQDVGREAIAVVLSGSGSDGSRGIVEVKLAGGLVLAETAASAKFDGMPLSALESGVVDHCHSPADLARVLCGLPPCEPAPNDVALSEDPMLDATFRLLRDAFGIDFSLYKITTVARRIQRRIDLLRIRDLHDYVDQLQADPNELDALYQDLLIGVTQFFRDPSAFEILEREVIPQIVDRVPADHEIRIWTAACATGEEAYTVAMLFAEELLRRNRPLNLKLLATDVHQRSLDFASAGVYGDEQLANVSADRLARFFTRRSSGYQVSQELRQLIVFARHNVTKDPPFTKMHFISCRNLLIYLQPEAQRTVLSLFHFGLVTSGVLYLGASETPGPLSDEFVSIHDHWKIFRKRRDVQLISQVRMPLTQTRRPPLPAEVRRSAGPDPLILATYDQLLDRYMPPGFLLDETGSLVDSFAGAEKLLRPRARRPTSDVLDMLDDDLRTVVGGAVQRALKDRSPVAYTDVRIHLSETESRCTLAAEPLFHPRTGARHVLVTFRESASPATFAEGTQPVPITEAARDRLETLESELVHMRETLQATIEELETSNEEMQATNEELVASNEELQSTNEELHSVNEELYTVNAECQHKISELKELNADMQHLLEGTDVGTVFLDRDLRIRRFTSRIASVFRFQTHDVGREINDFSHNIERDSLMEDILAVRRTGVVVEDEVRDTAGTPYFLRILPYRVSRGTPAIDGVVLTLTEMTALDKARARLAQLSAIVESSDDAIVGKSLDGTITSWNRGAELLYGYTAQEAMGKNVRMLMPSGADNTELEEFVARLRRGEKVEHAQSLRQRKDGSLLDVSITISPIHDRDGEIVGLSAIARDISPLVAANRELERREREIRTLLEHSEDSARRREQFLAMLSHELRNPLAAVMNATAVLAERPEAGTFDQCHSVIARQSAHIKRLLDDLLDVSRITRGKFALHLEDIDLREPVHAAIETTAPLVRERGIDLHVELPDQPVPVRGDAGRLMQVVGNLLANACNYSPSGSRVDLWLAILDRHASIRLRDHGVGIEREMLGRIFDLFVQSDRRLDRSHGGLGVGLSLARNIVELHAGMIAVTSDGPGAGSEFCVTLPLRETATAAPPRRRTVPPADRRRIVLVDDQDDAREMLRMLLESRNHFVLDTGDGASAIDLIQRERPDIAFIDVGMPVMNGYEVAQQIRRDRALDHITLVALTGYGAPSDLSAARAAGFNDHVIKPADLGRLEQILAELGDQ